MKQLPLEFPNIPAKRSIAHETALGQKIPYYLYKVDGKAIGRIWEGHFQSNPWGWRTVQGVGGWSSSLEEAEKRLYDEWVLANKRKKK